MLAGVAKVLAGDEESKATQPPKTTHHRRRRVRQVLRWLIEQESDQLHVYYSPEALSQYVSSH
jgi:hypothetical protein